MLDDVPRIGFELANAERNLLLLFVDAEDNGFDLLALSEHIGRAGDSLGPRKFRNVDQSFDAFLNLDKSAVRHKVCHLAVHGGAHWESLFNLVPRVALRLFESERYALFLFVDIEHDDINFLADLEKLTWVSESSPGHIGDMKQAIHPIEIDKRTEIGQVFDNAFDRVAQLHRLEESRCVFRLAPAR